MVQKQKIGWYTVIFLTLFPLVLWYLMLQPISLRFSNFYATLTSLGQISSLMGLALFALVLILSSRAQFLEPWFGGLNQVYIAHHLFGAVAFILLMLHPLFLTISFIPISFQYAAQFLLPGSNWQNNLGIAGLLSMMALLILTFFVNVPYHIWKLTHKCMGLAFFFGSFHFLVIPSDVSRNELLRVYMLVLISLGFAAYMYRTVLARFLVRKHRFAVNAVKQVGPNVIELRLEPTTTPLAFLPGQFVFIQFQEPAVSHESHPFSISSAPTNSGLTLTAKSLGDFTHHLSEVTVGTHALIEGPFGTFCSYLTPNKQQIWIAGGIGITPFLSMARSITPAYAVDLYYSVRDETEAVYVPELEQLATQHNFRLILWYTKTQGRLTAEMIDKTSSQIRQKDIFLCGPPSMMYSLKQQFRKLGIHKGKIHSEEFQML